MQTSPSSRILSTGISTILAFAAFTGATRAATKIWEGPGTDLATAANWSGDTLPAVNDTLRWDGTVAGPLALTLTNSTAFAGNNGYFIDVTAAQTSPLQIDNVTANTSTNAFRLANVTIAAGAGPVTFGDGSGTSVFVMGSGTVTGNTFTNDSANTATLASDIIWANGGAVAGRVLTLTGSGDWNMNSVFGITVTGGSGTFALAKRGTGTLTLTATNTYTAGTTIGQSGSSGGILRVDANGALGTGTVTISGNSNANDRLEMINGRTLANSITLGGRQGATALAPHIVSATGSNTLSGTLTFTTGGSNYSLQADAGSTLTLAAATSISGGATTGSRTLTFQGGGDFNVNGAIVNGTATLAVTKTGAGTLTLAGANTYTGTTTVSAGTLMTTPAQTGATTVTVADGATFGVRLATAGTTFNAGTLNTGTVTGATLLFEVGALGNPAAPIINATTFTPTAATTLKLTGTTLAIANDIPLLDYTGAIGGAGFAGLSLALPARTVGTLVDNVAATRVDLNITAIEQIKWKGNVSADWDIDPDGSATLGTQNWVTTTSLTPTKYLQGTAGTDTVNFDDSAAGNTNVNLAAGVTPIGSSFNNTALNYTLSSTGGFGIGGTGGLTKSGTGSLTIATANTYSGGTTLNAGTLNVNNNSALGTGPVTIAGGTLDTTTGAVLGANNLQNWNGDFSFTGSTDLDMGSGTVTVGGAGTDRAVTVTGGSLTVGEIVAPAHGLNLPGAGTLVVSSVGTGVNGSVVAGALNIPTGLLQINRTGASAGASGDFTAGGLTGAGIVVNGAAVERWLFINTASTSVFTGTLMNGSTGALGLNKGGSGTLTLSGANSYSGTTTVTAGTLAVTSTLGDTAINVTGGTLSLQNAGAVFPFTAKAITISGAGVLDQQVDFAIGGLASVVAQKSLTLSRPNSYTGETAINAGTGTTVTITDPTAAGSGRLTAASGATTPVFQLHIDGGGIIAMSNSFGGNSGVTTTIDVNNNGSGTDGVIQLNGTGLYGNGTLNVTGGNGYSLRIGGFTSNAGGAGTTILNPTTANLSLGTFSSSTNFAKTLQLDGTSAGNLLTGTISNGTNVVSLAKVNTSTWTLSGNNTYTGATTINGGTLVLAGTNTSTGLVSVGTGATLSVGSINAALGNVPKIDLGGGSSGGRLLYTGAGETTNRIVGASYASAGSTSIIDQSGSGTLKFTSDLGFTNTVAGTLILQGSSSGVGEIAGKIANSTGAGTPAISLTKAGSGTWNLTGANTYTGATLVNAGTLNTTPAQTGATTVTVADGATFGVTLATAGTTFSAGTLTTGTSTGSTLLFDTTTTGNPTAPVISAATFNPAAATLLRLTSSSLTAGNDIPLLDYTGSIGGVGFAGLSLALPARTSGTLVNNTIDTRVDLNITAAEQIKWKGNVSGDWDIDPDGTATLGTQNWLTTVLNTPTKYLQGTGGTDAANFDDSATGTSTVNLTATLTPLNTTVNNTTGGVPTYIFTGPGKLSGAGALLKQGSGTLILANTVAYDHGGGTTINGGTLQIGDGVTSGVGILPAGVITNNATLAFNMPDDLTLTQPIGGTGTIVKNNINTLTYGLATTNANAYTINDGVLRFSAGGTLSGVIGGTGQLQSSGGTLQLAGTTANTHTGLTTVSGGTLQLNKAAGVQAIGGDIEIGGTGVLAILANDQIADTATITFTGTSTDSTVGTTGTETVANLVISPSSPAGQFQMRNGFTVTGAATLNNGVLGVSSGHTGALNAVTMAGGILRIAGNTAASTLDIGAGGITASGGEIQVKFNTNNNDAVLNLGGDFTATGFVSITDANYNGPNLHIINLVGGPRTFDVAEFMTATVSPDIGDGTLNKAGDGTLALNGKLGTSGAFTLNANDGLTTINESQTIAALDIGAGATVVLNEDLTPAPAPGEGALALDAAAAGFDGAALGFGDTAPAAAVPEPGSVALLLAGTLGLLARRRRAVGLGSPCS